MPRFTPYRADGGRYVVVDDRDLPPEQQVAFCYRDPLPSEVAEFEDASGYYTPDDVRIVDGKTVVTTRRWHTSGASTSIRALVRLLTDVVGYGADGKRLDYPAPGKQTDDGRGGLRTTTDVDRERFLAGFETRYLYEVAEHILERKHLSEEESGN